METDSQALNHLLTEASVDWKGLTGEIARQADALLGGDDSALILDESAFAKKGRASAGVARQWNGRLGKVDNAQVGVFFCFMPGPSGDFARQSSVFAQKPGRRRGTLPAGPGA